jgi:hypothetical protein
MSTATKKATLQIKTTLSGLPLQVWEEFEKRNVGAGKSSLIRMLLIEYAKLLENKQQQKANASLLENIIDNGSPERITKDEMEEVMADWWDANKSNIRKFVANKINQ